VILPAVCVKKERFEARGNESYVEGQVQLRIEDLEQRRRKATAVMGLTNIVDLAFAVNRSTNSGKWSKCSQL
jgi:hypothetical protein